MGVVSRVPRNSFPSGFNGEGSIWGGNVADVQRWDVSAGQFRAVVQDMPTSKLSLMPPCCGLGAGCPHLQEHVCWPWPNGDPISDADFNILTAVGLAAEGRDAEARARANKRKSADTFSDEDRAALKRLRSKYRSATLKQFEDTMAVIGAKRTEAYMDGLLSLERKSASTGKQNLKHEQSDGASDAEPEVEIDTAGPDQDETPTFHGIRVTGPL